MIIHVRSQYVLGMISKAIQAIPFKRAQNQVHTVNTSRTSVEL